MIMRYSWVTNKENFDDDWWEKGAPLNDKRVREKVLKAHGYIPALCLLKTTNPQVLWKFCSSYLTTWVMSQREIAAAMYLTFVVMVVT